MLTYARKMNKQNQNDISEYYCKARNLEKYEINYAL